MKSIHDRPWYKKVHKKDSKNFRILIGHGRKQPKYAKKGGPFKHAPPKRRRASKLSAPMGVGSLEEGGSPPTFDEVLMSIKSGDIRFKTKKKIDPYFVTILLANKTYNGKISGDNLTVIDSERGEQAATKEEFLKELRGYGEICDVVYCKESFLTAGGKTKSFHELLNPPARPQQTEAPSKVKKIKTKVTAAGGPVATVDAVAAVIAGGLQTTILNPEVESSAT